MTRRFLTFVFSALVVFVAQVLGEVLPAEPGPEDEGLRLRLTVTPRSDVEGYDVCLDLLNVADHAITLRAGWPHEDPGDVKDYIEAATSIESEPAVAPWVGGVQAGSRKASQPEYVLSKRETLQMRWQTTGRHLKNRVTNPNEVQDPEFPFPGLYAVHATVNVITNERTVRLRSNEQLVSVGGSRAMPRYTLGQLIWVDAASKRATLNLGALHKVQPGDRFEVGHPKGAHWKLTITHVDPESSIGSVEVLTPANHPAYSSFPQRLMEATLMR